MLEGRGDPTGGGGGLSRGDFEENLKIYFAKLLFRDKALRGGGSNSWETTRRASTSSA